MYEWEKDVYDLYDEAMERAMEDYYGSDEWLEDGFEAGYTEY